MSAGTTESLYPQHLTALGYMPPTRDENESYILEHWKSETKPAASVYNNTSTCPDVFHWLHVNEVISGGKYHVLRIILDFFGP